MDLKFLEFPRFRPVAPAPAPVFDGLSQVRAYWEALRQAGSLPARAALDPRGLSGMLDRVFLAERIGRGVVQVRIAGSGLADFAGIDLRGLPLCCLFATESRPGFAALAEEVCTTPAVAEVDLASDRGNGCVGARMLLLPLADEGDRRLVLGAISFAGASMARCKFQIARRQTERLALPAPATPAPRAAVHAHLRLVHCRDE